MSADKFVVNDETIHVNRWNSVIEQWRNKKNCDVEFICRSDRKILAHSVVLVSAGFDIDIGGSSRGTVNIDLPLKVMTKIVEYCYYGRLEIGATELNNFMIAFSRLKARRLFDAVEDYFAKNVHVVPQQEFNGMSVSCLRSLSSKCLDKKDFWLNVFFHWAEVDETNRTKDYMILSKQIHKQEPFTEGFEQIPFQMPSTSGGSALSELLKKHQSYNQGVPFYFLFQYKMYMYNRSEFILAPGYPKISGQTKDIIMISPERKFFLEIRADKSLIISHDGRKHKSKFIIDGYSLNPALLILSDGRVMKVIQNQFQQEKIFHHVPQLSAVIPKIDCESPQCIEYVKNNGWTRPYDCPYRTNNACELIFLRNQAVAFSFYSKMCIISDTSPNEWVDIGLEGMHYIDTCDEGGLFGFRHQRDCHRTQKMYFCDGKFSLWGEFGSMDWFTYPLPFLSTWNSTVYYSCHYNSLCTLQRL